MHNAFTFLYQSVFHRVKYRFWYQIVNLISEWMCSKRKHRRTALTWWDIYWALLQRLTNDGSALYLQGVGRHFRRLLLLFSLHICEDSSHREELLTRGCGEASSAVTAPSIVDIHARCRKTHRKVFTNRNIKFITQKLVVFLNLLCE